MKHFTLRLKHDAGYVSIRTVARSESVARQLVCDAERCPPSAIRRVYVGKTILEAL
ncbi:hypothetical protein [Rhodoferax antarcticus]|uniref:Uncharacterized protein n=1 Tax=Rhodoferax antarcticus ANT.BR TaxID=1111071 RepID=A0A1Q8Y8Z6_9BURK|nr:hypothetical protein [Rhodoferax antarcticus]OLP04495.1 hypothetical protein BLL52_4254 [Rhodoferax antarcticus ANT.BR]